MRALFYRRLHDFGGCQADAVVMNLHPAIAGPGGDLFGPVGMAVKTGFAHQKRQRPPQFGRHRLHRCADGFQAFGAV